MLDGAGLDLSALVGASRSGEPVDRILAALQEELTRIQSALADLYRSPRMGRALALKLGNVALLHAQFRARHTRLLSKPIAFQVDPANACQLKCPGCIHRDDDHLSYWGKAILDFDGPFRVLMRDLGAEAVHCVFFNWGEPLINKRLPDMVREARRHLLGANVSSNLSLSFDAEALVASGLEWLTVSADGVSQPVLEIYRRGVRADLVLENMRALVAAKRKLGSCTPFIEWQYIMFDHNLAEMAEAEALAREIGLNQIRFCPSYDFASPEITTRDVPEARTIVLDDDAEAIQLSFIPNLQELSPDIDDAFGRFLAQRVDADFDPLPQRRNECLWLYEQTVMDGRGQIYPCCMNPQGESWVFGEAPSELVYNSDRYQAGRRLDGAGTPCDGCPHAAGDFPLQRTAATYFPDFLHKADWLGAIPVGQLQQVWLP